MRGWFDMSDVASYSTMAPEERRKQMLRAVVASTVGTSIEWYDYFLFATMAALVFPTLFFPKSDPVTGTLNSFGILFVGFLARPIGAWLFGTYGDRIGRKATLIATLLFMGIATFLIGLMPTYSTLGLGAAVILIILRACQGLGVGGEWGGSVLMSMEWGSQKRKGWLGSWPQFGVPIGLVLANGITALTVTMAGTATFNAWAWRVPFLLSIALVGVGLYIRLGTLETPVFQALLQERDRPQRSSAPSRAGAVLSVHDIRVHLRRICDQARQAVPDLGGQHGGACVLHHDSSVRPPVRRDRTQDDVSDRHHRHGGVGLRVLRALCRRRRDRRLCRDRPFSHPPRHAIRTAGGAHRRELHGSPALQRSVARISARFSHRRRSGADHWVVPLDGEVRVVRRFIYLAVPDQDPLYDQRVHPHLLRHRVPGHSCPEEPPGL